MIMLLISYWCGMQENMDAGTDHDDLQLASQTTEGMVNSYFVVLKLC